MSKIDYERLDENNLESQLESNVEVETFISKIGKHLLKYDLKKIFGDDKKYRITDIGKTIKWMKKFASGSTSSFFKDMEWSHMLRT